MVKHLNVKNEKCLATIGAMNAEIDGLKASLKELQEDGMKKDIDIDAMRREIEIANGQLSDYKTAHQELEQKYSANIASFKELESKHQEIQRKSDHYNASLIDKNIHLQKLIEENEDLKNEYDGFQKDAEAKMSNLGTEINELQNDICEKESRYKQESKQWKDSSAQMTAVHQKEIEEKTNQSLPSKNKCRIKLIRSNPNCLKLLPIRSKISKTHMKNLKNWQNETMNCSKSMRMKRVNCMKRSKHCICCRHS